MRPFSPAKKHEPVRRGEINRAFDAIERIDGISVSAPLELINSPSGPHIRWAGQDSFWAIVSADPSSSSSSESESEAGPFKRHYIREIELDEDGAGYEVKENGISGDAWEVNNRTVDLGVIVRVFPQGSLYHFELGAGSTASSSSSEPPTSSSTDPASSSSDPPSSSDSSSSSSSDGPSSSSSPDCPDVGVSEIRIIDNHLWYRVNCVWVDAGSVCCTESSSSSSQSSSSSSVGKWYCLQPPSSSSSSMGTYLTTCCDDPIPDTVYCTLADSSGCACLDSIVVQLTYDDVQSNPGIDYYVWSGSADACAGYVNVALICYTPGAFPYGWRLSVRCNGQANGEFDVQANGKTCPESGPLQITFGPMTTELDTCCDTGSSTFTATITE